MTSGHARGPRAALAAALAVLICAATSEGWGDGCVVRSIGVDTTHANVRDAVYTGRAWSQVFVAEDTLISSITVWRAGAPDSNSTPVRLYILDVIPYAYAPPIDTLIGPDPTRILLEGPRISVPYAPDHALPERLDLNPPIALPKRGTLTFAVKVDSPFCCVCI